jgi:adenylosuccinate synthase
LEPFARRAIAIVDLGFGDSGKGLTTDYLTRRFHTTAIVRLGGGAQVGHNVVTPDGRHHCFSQWGAGTFTRSTNTWLGPEFVLHPTALLLEAEHLSSLGVVGPLQRLHIHADALVITPMQQAFCRLRELLRGPRRHGSCGVGVGEVTRDLAAGALVIRARLLRDRLELTRRLRELWEYKRTEWQALEGGELGALPAEALPAESLPAITEESRIFTEPRLLDHWVGEVWPLGERLIIVNDEQYLRELRGQEHIVFEGAQGLLLDKDAGFFPYVTYGSCTFAAADALAKQLGLAEGVAHVGVTRSYAVRHGPGPMPSELRPTPSFVGDAHNVDGAWQGVVRYGWLDKVLLRYAHQVLLPLDALMVTHLDRVANDFAWIERYSIPRDARWLCSETTIPRVNPWDFDARRALTDELGRAGAQPEQLALSARYPGLDYAERIASFLSTRGLLGSFGPRATDVVELSR